MRAAFFFWPAGWASGHETFQASLLEGLLAQDRHEIVVVADEDDAPQVPRPHTVRTINARRALTRGMPVPIGWIERGAAAALRSIGPDVLIACANFPFPQVPEIPLIATLHEVDFMDADAGRWFDARTIQQLTVLTRSALSRAVAVWANSSYTAARAVADCGVAPDRTRVTSPAVRPFVGGQTSGRSYAPYVAQVGWFHPRKNTPFVLRSWAEARRAGLAHHLVLIGRDGPRSRTTGGLGRQILEHAGEFADDVHLTGLVDRAEYGRLLRGSSALLVGSFQEGFCVPVIEAYSVGTPVVAVDRTALTEVVGKVGTLVDGVEVAFADAIVKAVATPPDALALQTYASRFTPEAQARAALETLDAIEAGRWPYPAASEPSVVS